MLLFLFLFDEKSVFVGGGRGLFVLGYGRVVGGVGVFF